MQAPLNDIIGIVLAAGKGTRMGSELPKVLHELCGKPLLKHVIDTLECVGIQKICLVVSPDTHYFLPYYVEGGSRSLCVQNKRQGTGDAVAAAAASIEGVALPRYSSGSHFLGAKLAGTYCLVCYGDVPRIPAGIIKDFIEQTLASQCSLGVIAMNHPQPTGYGRVLVDSSGYLDAIIEDRDADTNVKKVRLCNTGVVFARCSVLFDALCSIEPNNVQAEYYLTDVFGKARHQDHRTYVYVSNDYKVFDGVNTKQQLAEMEGAIKQS